MLVLSLVSFNLNILIYWINIFKFFSHYSIIKIMYYCIIEINFDFLQCLCYLYFMQLDSFFPHNVWETEGSNCEWDWPFWVFVVVVFLILLSDLEPIICWLSEIHWERDVDSCYYVPMNNIWIIYENTTLIHSWQQPDQEFNPSTATNNIESQPEKRQNCRKAYCVL